MVKRNVNLSIIAPKKDLLSDLSEEELSLTDKANETMTDLDSA